MKLWKWCVALAVCAAMAGCSNDSDSSGTSGPKAVKVQKLKKLTLDCGQNVQIDLVLIPKGKFMMGSLSTEEGHEDKESPRHEVTLTKPFYLGVTEVTQKQYEAVMGENPSHTKGEQNPVEFVSWQNAVKFCQKLSQKTGKTVRLPAETEWEYACRAGTETPWYWGADPGQMGTYAWFKGNAGNLNETHPVAQKLPNQWGLYDMIGNVFELVRDNDSAKYNGDGRIDPTGNAVDVGIKIARGGSVNYEAKDKCRAAARLPQGIGVTLYEVGFRVACDAE